MSNILGSLKDLSSELQLLNVKGNVEITLPLIAFEELYNETYPDIYKESKVNLKNLSSASFFLRIGIEFEIKLKK